MARQAPAFRSAPQQRFVRPQNAPQPRFASPRQAPSIQRIAPQNRAATRFERRQQIIQQRQQTARPNNIAPSAVTNNAPNPRLQQLESQRRLSRGERRELRTLQRNERQNARQQNLTADQQKTAATGNANQQRLQTLESKRRLNRSERRELNRLRRDERQNAQQNQGAGQDRTAATTNNNQQRIQDLQSKGRLNRSERRELRRLQRDERRNAANPQQQSPPQTAVQTQQRQEQRQDRRQRAARAPLTPAQVTQGRFASNLSQFNNNRRAGRRAARLASRIAWQLGVLAPYVPWRGPVYWPYAYNDLFYYTFWPDSYDPGYWAYAYDDFFDGVFFPDGAPYAEYAAEGPYDGAYARTTTTGVAPSRSYSSSGGGNVPGRVNQATREFCADQATGITAWPIDKIANAVGPNNEQKKLLDDLRQASQQAASEFKDACPDAVPLTPPGRLQAMTQRLQAMDDAVTTVKPALEAFTNSLSDEQKARFNELGPTLRGSQKAAATPDQTANCSSEKAGLSSLAVDRIESALQPTEAQEASLDRLDDALQQSVDTLRNACPNVVPLTPVGRLDVMKQRLDAMIQAANAVRPALEDFYAALTDEQKAKFNRLGRQSAQSAD
ncbi:Spy/CpxP family protein refolding chaperone [Rhodoplanes sp. Z2-YC6860]|uniref:Spy/CpxP family protein refolding chaperone n=1 Tax=Rhodoplanes sp. Z2-YC6860 TaxID=674703 RepID=UPI00078DDF18|nr:Spy/CpxP family protein refolding chaperone [Rhodoplanes sp. Z2-YC6860]AMN45158.1 exonuclease VII, large subunit [Rhodoplanes sp. Z2-YC6860]